MKRITTVKIIVMSVNFDCKSPLLDEIITSRQLKSENSTLLSTNLMYKQQIAQLEVEISDLKALVTAKNYELKIAKETEAQGLRKSLNFGSSQKINLFSQEPKENQKLETLDMDRVKILLDKEKQINKLLLGKIQELRAYIEDFEKNHQPSACSSKISYLERQVVELTEENDYLKRKFLTPTFVEPSEATFETSQATRPDNNSDEASEVRAANVPHRLKTNFQKEVFRRKSESNKKSLTPGRIVKRFTCNLSDILNSTKSTLNPGLTCKTAEFCPSTMRRLKVQSSVVN